MELDSDGVGGGEGGGGGGAAVALGAGTITDLQVVPRRALTNSSIYTQPDAADYTGDA